MKRHNKIEPIKCFLHNGGDEIKTEIEWKYLGLNEWIVSQFLVACPMYIAYSPRGGGGG